jgi:hypothetical protein
MFLKNKDNIKKDFMAYNNDTSIRKNPIEINADFSKTPKSNEKTHIAFDGSGKNETEIVLKNSTSPKAGASVESFSQLNQPRA